MKREEGTQVLCGTGWLSSTPDYFQDALLTGSRWYHLEAGAEIQGKVDLAGEMTGIADGVVELSSTVVAVDAPLIHLGYPGLWFGFFPSVFRQPRRTNAIAKTPVWLAGVSQPTVTRMLADRPDWWLHFMQLGLVYGDLASVIAADLLIRRSDRRCAAVLLRLSGIRFVSALDASPPRAPLTQDELAAAANMSRNTTGAVLKKLAGQGLVEIGFKGVTVRDPEALRAFANQG